MVNDNVGVPQFISYLILDTLVFPNLSLDKNIVGFLRGAGKKLD